MFKRTVGGVLGAVAILGLSSASAIGQTIPPSNVGAGAVTGKVEFAPGMGVPAAGTPCDETSWTFEGGSPEVGGTSVPSAAAINTVLTGYAGPVSITAWGGSECENGEGGFAVISLTATGRGPTGSELDCPAPGGPPLTGLVERTGTHTEVDVGGQCVVNRYGISNVRFKASGEFLPTDPDGNPAFGPGLLEPVQFATFTGAFRVEPA